MNPAITHRHVIVRLLNGPIYQEDLDLWGRLGAEWEKIKNHFLEMGLEVARDDSAGYAFIRQSEDTDESVEEWEDTETAPLPQGTQANPPYLPSNNFHGYFAGRTYAFRAGSGRR